MAGVEKNIEELGARTEDLGEPEKQEYAEPSTSSMVGSTKSTPGAVKYNSCGCCPTAFLVLSTMATFGRLLGI